MDEKAKKYPTYEKYPDEVRKLLKPQVPGRDPAEFNAWLTSASAEDMFNEAERLCKTHGPRSEFNPIVQKLLSESSERIRSNPL